MHEGTVVVLCVPQDLVRTCADPNLNQYEVPAGWLWLPGDSTCALRMA